MRTKFSGSLAAAVLSIAALNFVVAVNPIKAQFGPPPTPQADESQATAGAAGAEALTQGPVHEAFAKPLELNPQPIPLINKRPPEPIPEIPPAQKPDGDNIVWIPGYWSWDDGRSDYIWVSGVYRAAPPYQTWVPGYWEEVEGGFQWTPGFWTATAKSNVDYVPTPPPESQEHGPTSPQPSENHFWVPGNWVYQNVNITQPYAWRAGYWAACQPDWIFIPAHWVWTPGGFVFIDGYWDYTLQRRGCLFAPMYYSQPLYLTAGYSFTPSVLINVGLFNDCLFARPRYCSYYFGDYFGPRYVSLGFQPWVSAGLNVNFGFDPLFSYYRWSNVRRNPNWLASTRQHFELASRNDALRPPRTFLAQQQLLKTGGAKPGNNLLLATTLKQAATNPGQTGLKFHNISQADRMALAENGRQLQQVSSQRLELEKNNVKTFKGNGTGFVGGAGGTGPALGGAINNTASLGKLKLPTAASSNLKVAAGAADNSSATQGNFGNRDNGSKTRFDRSLQGTNSSAGSRGGNNSINSIIGGNDNNPLGGSGQRFNGRSGRSGVGSTGQGAAGVTGSGADSGGTTSGRFQQFNLNNRGGQSGNTNESGGSSGQQGNFLGRGSNIGPSGNGGAGGAAGAGGGGGGAAGSGGGAGRGQQPKNDKDDSKKKTSSFTPPQTNFELDPQYQSRSHYDMQKVFKGDRDQPRTSMDEVTRDMKSAQSPKLGLHNDEDELSISNPRSPSTGNPSNNVAGILAGRSGGANPMSPNGGADNSSLSGNGPPGANQAGYPRQSITTNNSPPIPGSSNFDNPNPGNLRALNPQPQAPLSPYLARYDYQTLVNRGRTLSTNPAAGTSSFSSPADNTSATSRSTKDPVVSYGYPYGAARTAYGPGPTGPSSPANQFGQNVSPLTSGPYNSQGVSGLNAPQQSGMYAPSKSGIAAQMSSGISAPMTSGISGVMSSGVSAPMSSGYSAPMTSGISGLSNPGTQFGSGSYIAPGGGYTPPTAGSLTGGSSGAYIPTR